MNEVSGPDVNKFDIKRAQELADLLNQQTIPSIPNPQPVIDEMKKAAASLGITAVKKQAIETIAEMNPSDLPRSLDDLLAFILGLTETAEDRLLNRFEQDDK